MRRLPDDVHAAGRKARDAGFGSIHLDGWGLNMATCPSAAVSSKEVGGKKGLTVDAYAPEEDIRATRSSPLCAISDQSAVRQMRPSAPIRRGGCSARKNDFDFGELARLGIDLD